MPLKFESMKEYLPKLEELVSCEATYSQLDMEMVAEKDVHYVFEERHEIYSKLRLRMSKRN